MACSHQGTNNYLNQCWNIANWTLKNKLQWTLNRNWNIFIKKNAFKNVVTTYTQDATYSDRALWHLSDTQEELIIISPVQ